MNELVIENELKDKEFHQISDLVFKKVGIVLHEEKRALVYSRLSRLLRSLEISTFREYCKILEDEDNSEEIGYLINAITTNLTKFFREIHHFEHVRDVIIAEKVQQSHSGGFHKEKLRFWSAGCSSGEEPYSLAMTLANAIPNLGNFDIKILATDIDTNMINKAQTGIYKDHSTIDKHLFDHYCSAIQQDAFQIKEQIKSLITFKQLNLLEYWPMHGPFDAIFCRNVVIYFDKDTQKTLFDRMADLLNPEGYLYIGHSESLYKICDRFQLVGHTIYQKVD
jgi:chemotaxis protein methyltransferase CheR